MTRTLAPRHRPEISKHPLAPKHKSVSPNALTNTRPRRRALHPKKSRTRKLPTMMVTTLKPPPGVCLLTTGVITMTTSKSIARTARKNHLAPTSHTNPKPR